MRKLDRDFYRRDTTEAAQVLLGKIIVVNTADGRLSGRIVETESYSFGDPAAHSTKGRTPRTEVMFGEAGHAYIYFIHGLHHCMNIVSHPDDVPGGVLIRALEPIEGIEQMRQNRGMESITALCSGPGKLTQAMQIDKSLLGEDLLGDRLYVVDDGVDVGEIVARPRIGVTLAADRLLRFYPAKYRQWVSRP
ncbi:MAG: DNA-3-methyladenine glycosylase [Armatimonadetes bacterium]|jgi:DNA-3-methyladenine glycosylase|nr:DNA-3-methyladenine glycosylase [Armatimonadota bacterium]